MQLQLELFVKAFFRENKLRFIFVHSSTWMNTAVQILVRTITILVLLSPHFLLAQTLNWNPIQINSREYLSVDEIARYYGMAIPVANSLKQQTIRSENRFLTVHANSREAIINGVNHTLSFETKVMGNKAYVSRTDLVKTIEPLLRPYNIKTARIIRTVVLDPGHGGGDNGARSRFSADEKALTLDVARRLKPLLEQAGFRVVMTRNRDVFVPLEARADVAATIPDSILVSIHFNAGQSHAAGVETYCLAPRSTPSTAAENFQMSDLRDFPGNQYDANNVLLASLIQRRLSRLRNNVSECRSVKRARFVVLRDCPRPSVLIEGGFVTGRSDASLINNPDFRQRMAEAITRALIEYQASLQGRSVNTQLVMSPINSNFEQTANTDAQSLAEVKTKETLFAANKSSKTDFPTALTKESSAKTVMQSAPIKQNDPSTLSSSSDSLNNPAQSKSSDNPLGLPTFRLPAPRIQPLPEMEENDAVK